jgi:hypothetical protein
MNTQSKAKIGFVYRFEHLSADGDVLSVEDVHNLIPDQGRDYILTAALLLGSQFNNWFIGLYEGSYAPQASDTMATFVASATEITAAYAEAARLALVPNALAAGVFVNAASPAVFTFTAEKTVRGGFISSGSVKGGATGILLSAVLASSPKVVGAGESLRVTAGLSLVTV